jgi:deoxyribonuclease V
LGGFADMTAGAKARRLLNEGVEVLADRVDLNRTVFDQFTGDRPLLALHGLQDRLHTELQIGAPLAKPRFVAGVDVSYRGEMGSAALALYDLASHTIVRTVETSQIVRFPYITSYLAFRELPALLSVIESATQLGIEFDTLIVDGSGILHPRRCGIASMLGLACQIPSIGVTKKLLIGRIDKSEGTPRQPVIITVDGTNLGAALWARSTSTKRLFVSPGYHMDVTTAVAVVRQCLSGHRLPEPLYWADKRSRQAARTTGSDTTGSDVQNSELA